MRVQEKGHLMRFTRKPVYAMYQSTTIINVQENICPKVFCAKLIGTINLQTTVFPHRISRSV